MCQQGSTFKHLSIVVHSVRLVGLQTLRKSISIPINSASTAAWPHKRSEARLEFR